MISLLNLGRPKEICQIQNEWLKMASIWCSYYCPYPLPCYWAIILSHIKHTKKPLFWGWCKLLQNVSLNSLLQICDLTKQALITHTKCFISSIAMFAHNQESSLLAFTSTSYTNILNIDMHFLMATNPKTSATSLLYIKYAL